MNLKFKSNRLYTVSGKGIILAKHLVVRGILILDQNYGDELSTEPIERKRNLLFESIFTGALVT